MCLKIGMLLPFYYVDFKKGLYLSSYSLSSKGVCKYNTDYDENGSFFFSSIAVSFTVKQMTALYVKNFNYGIKALLLLCFISASLFHSSMSQANCVIHISREKQTNKKTSLWFKSERFVVFTERDWTQRS